MRVFEHPNWLPKADKDKFNKSCPICKTTDDKPVVLIGIAGTQDKENKIMEALQVHLECFEPYYYPDFKVFVQKTP